MSFWGWISGNNEEEQQNNNNNDNNNNDDDQLKNQHINIRQSEPVLKYKEYKEGQVPEHHLLHVKEEEEEEPPLFTDEELEEIMNKNCQELFDEKFEIVKQFYGIEKTKLANIEIIKLEFVYNKHIDDATDQAEDAKSILDLMKDNTDPVGRMIIRIKREAAAVKSVLDYIEHDDGWELCRDDQDVKTYFRQIPDSPTYLIKIKGVVESPAFDVLACVNEIDLYKKWIPTVVESDIKLSISDYKKIVYLQFDPPSPISWVVSNRDMALYGYGVDMMEDNKLVAMARTVYKEDEEELQKDFPEFSIPPETEDRIRMECMLAGLLFEPVSPTKTKVAVLSCVDPKISLPYWIINTSTKSLAHMMFVYLRNQAANLDQEYIDRINQDGGIYENIRERLNENNNNNNDDNNNEYNEEDNNNNEN